jgi:hypothetical protein
MTRYSSAVQAGWIWVSDLQRVAGHYAPHNPGNLLIDWPGLQAQAQAKGGRFFAGFRIRHSGVDSSTSEKSSGIQI